MTSKKGQEEIVGFLLIIIIVMVLGFVFLFMLKPNTSDERDFQLDNLIYAMVGTTMNGMTIGERIESCEKGEGCDVLRDDLNNLTDIVFDKVGYSLGKNIKGYNLTISEGMQYSNSAGTVTSRSLSAVSVRRNSLIKLKFYY